MGDEGPRASAFFQTKDPEDMDVFSISSGSFLQEEQEKHASPFYLGPAMLRFLTIC
jgi:hypothetical protein